MQSSESIVNALVHLFAIFESVKEDFHEDSGRLVVEPFLKKTLNQELTTEYLNLFYDYLSFYREANSKSAESSELGIDSTSLIQIAKICNQLNKELLKSERITVFIELMELIRADEKVSEKEREFASLVAMNFNLRHKEVEDIKAFIFEPDSGKIAFDKALIIDSKITEWPEEMAWMMRKKKNDLPGATRYFHMHAENMFGRILVLFVESVEMYVMRYDGPLNLYLDGRKVISRKSYFLKPGAILKGPNIASIYEIDITRQFQKEKIKNKIILTGEEVEFQFKNSSNGIKKFNFSEESGQLIGIMGGSGTGKSTLLNILNGKIEPTDGRVHINGHSLQRAAREGVIGYVPQDDLLFEELTVYENLFFNASICFSDFSKSLIQNTVEKVLSDLDLSEISDLKVGDPLNKTISGGQRKRLNIALELMREPAVLFVDEPTSGLSSTDSEKVMMLLKDQARKGKLVIAIIHQPSSDIFKLFDKLWLLDKGGYPVYTGNPVDAIVYFKTMSTQVNAAESECQTCGNVIPEKILQIIESKEIDDAGNATPYRKVTPKAWYLKYKENIESRLKRHRYTETLPATNFQIPSTWRQFLIFSHRNFRTKLSNTQYIIINVLEAPLLAFVLGFFSKYDTDGVYTLMDNKNLPVFLFMAIVVGLFMGMSVSAEEIFKDRKILERESFLNLSRMSYINSKLAFLFTLSAFQMFCFVAVAHVVLEIHGQFWIHWLVLFSTACVANLIGLTISSSLNSIIAIYISIPFILVPQLLLGGAMINFDELHSSFTNKKYVPLVGDLMVSRWAYEALAVGQYKLNAFEKHFYTAEQEISESSFMISFTLPRLESLAGHLSDTSEKKLTVKEINLLKNEIKKIGKRYTNLTTPYDLDRLDLSHPISTSAVDHMHSFLATAKVHFRNKYAQANKKKDSIYYQLVDKFGKEGFLDIKKQNYNQQLADIVTARNTLTKIVVTPEELIQKKDPIYTMPQSSIGRAHFYAPYKIVFGWKIETLWFDLFIIWMISALLYLLLLKDSVKKLIHSLTFTRVPAAFHFTNKIRKKG